MEKIFVTDGTPIAYERVGTGPTLLLVHGGLSDHRQWQRVQPLLALHFTTYIIDRRGHGESGPYSADHTIEHEYQDVADVIAAINEPVYLLGHSAGARIALHAALLSPLVPKLVLYEPPDFGGPLPPQMKAKLQASLDDKDWERLVSIGLGEVIMRVDTSSPEVIQALQQRPIWKWALTNAASIPAELNSYGEYKFNPSQFKTFVTPTSLLLGSASPPAMQQSVRNVQAALTNSRIDLLQGQEHVAMLVAPELFTQTVVSFLNQEVAA